MIHLRILKEIVIITAAAKLYFPALKTQGTRGQQSACKNTT